ncbi:MAG TPA: hypothetical protein VK968_17190, partial [Roseimicrobium sp.]|nr:hypothetical protein [Roseimicrobium sp.]
STGTLTTFLAKPDANHEWTRMPNFRLTKEEADQLAAYILANGDEPKSAVASTDTALLEKGAKLLETTGCVACHGGTKLKNELKSKPAADLAAAQWNKGCMADEPDAKAPAFGFSAGEKAALRAFAATDRQSLQRHVPADFAERQTTHLNCTECHGKIDGFPGLPIIGGKLKPEWAASFIGGKVSYKPRPWLEARMPGFAKRADALAEGLAMEHGLPPKTPAQPEVDKEASEIGRTLVGSDGGLSCLACHAVGKLGATQVFESAGINFAYTGERLQPTYFHRWLLNPLRVDPQTKMPVYFDQGRSPLGDYYGGDAHKQIDALWNYIRLGPNMPLPKDANQ